MTIQPPMVIFNGQPVTADVDLEIPLYAYKDVDLWVTVTALNGTPSNETFDLKFTRKHPREGTNWLDISGKAITQVTQGTSLPSTQFIHLDETDLNSEDLRMEIDVAFTGSTQWTVDITAILRL